MTKNKIIETENEICQTILPNGKICGHERRFHKKSEYKSNVYLECSLHCNTSRHPKGFFYTDVRVVRKIVLNFLIIK